MNCHCEDSEMNAPKAIYQDTTVGPAAGIPVPMSPENCVTAATEIQSGQQRMLGMIGVLEPVGTEQEVIS